MALFSLGGGETNHISTPLKVLSHNANAGGAGGLVFRAETGTPSRMVFRQYNHRQIRETAGEGISFIGPASVGGREDFRLVISPLWAIVKHCSFSNP